MSPVVRPPTASMKHKVKEKLIESDHPGPIFLSRVTAGRSKYRFLAAFITVFIGLTIIVVISIVYSNQSTWFTHYRPHLWEDFKPIYYFKRTTTHVKKLAFIKQLYLFHISTDLCFCLFVCLLYITLYTLGHIFCQNIHCQGHFFSTLQLGFSTYYIDQLCGRNMEIHRK